jgi:ArsR family metal-binding transcriptional regulator
MKLNVMELIKLLPRTNCKECGEVTCMAYAAKLAKGEVQLEACRPLFAAEFANNLTRLRELVKGAA